MPDTLVTPKPHLALSSPLVELLDKPAADFTRADILDVIVRKQIERITFHYTGIDGKLKELKLPISSIEGAEILLAQGERVDGSSLFNGVVETGASDLYVVPVYRTAFLNPFDDRSLDFVCRYFNRQGELASFAPDNILQRATDRLERSTGCQLRALGELEFYLLSEQSDALFPAEQQRAYHASGPFLKSGHVIDEMLRHIEQITGAVKYGHGEVGWIGRVESDSPEIRGKIAEQFEIEFLPLPIEQCADALVIARWIIRNVAYQHRCVATFTPKLEEGAAGNGLHIHMELVRTGRNLMTNSDGTLSSDALKLIGGLCTHADVLVAFGNTTASSYLRLVPNQEAPTRICWSDMNRSALIRVPLGWNNVGRLADRVNPPEGAPAQLDSCQTVELRTPDGSAHIHLLLAGITTVAEAALSNENSLTTASERYVTASGLKDEQITSKLQPLPHSCAEAARLLEEKRDFFERDGLFPSAVVDYILKLLRDEKDERLAKDLRELGPQQRSRFMRQIMHRHLHRH
ncbi:MAG: glutamine synthetase beta-grasp domain-containing protein [Terriglobales bacterium]